MEKTTQKALGFMTIALFVILLILTGAYLVSAISTIGFIVVAGFWTVLYGIVVYGFNEILDEGRDNNDE